MGLHYIKKSPNLIVAVLLLVAGVLTGWPAKVSAFAGGDGTEEAPYRIEDCDQLQSIQDDLDAYYVLTTNINCAETAEWNEGAGFDPIGENGAAFLGELDGDYHTISGLYVNNDSWQTGLFGRIGESNNQVGLVKDLGLINADINGEWSTGGVAGVLYGQINNVHITGEVNGDGEVGGLVGSHGGVWDTVIDSWSDADVSGGSLVGGLVGYNEQDSNVINSFATGNVQGTGYRVGGAVGYNRGNVTNVHATGNVWGQSDDVGGLVGQNGGNGAISKSYATGYVQGDYSNVGGLVGRNGATIEKSYSNNTASGDESVGVYGYCITGGLVGSNASSANVTNSFSRSSTEDVECISAGLVGVNEGSITWTYATGASDDGAGPGLVGDNESIGQVWSSFWDEDTTGTSTGCAYGTFDCTEQYRAMGRTTSEMKTEGNYTDPDLSEGVWDFENIWYIDPEVNDGYPFFINGDVGANPPEWQQPEETPSEDLNGDSIPDNEQPHVSGYTSPITGKTVVIDVGEGCELQVDDLVTESNLTVQDPAYDYGNGLFDFEADCVDETTTVRLFYYDVTKDDLVVRKYNSNSNTYFNLTGQYGATLQQTTIGGHTVTIASYQITDGGDLDMDGTVNGTIIDPVGLAALVVGSPNTGIKKL